MAVSFKGAKKYKKHNGFSKNITIKTPLPSPVHFFNMAQDRNIILNPCVNIGDNIMKGQKLADLDIYEALPVFSSVSGIVTSIHENIITIENDMLDDNPVTADTAPPDTLTTRELLWLIREGGIRDTRTGAPLHILLSAQKVPDCVIVCCFDSDPYSSADQTAALGNSEKILKALNIVLRLLGTNKAFIAVEQGCANIYSDFKYNLRYNKNIFLQSLKACYPQSRSDILIKTVTGKNTDHINAVVLSSETLCMLSDVLTAGQPITDKLVTVSGDDILVPSVYNTPIGMPISALIANSGYNEPQVLIKNGVLSGIKINNPDEPVMHNTNSISAFNDKKNIPNYAKELI